MPLVSSRELLLRARDTGTAIGAFNCSNMEIAQAIITAAHAEQKPVIIQVTAGAVKYAGLEMINGIVKTAARNTPVPVVLHLDHGNSFELVVQCVKEGFTSVMIDGSHLPLQENIALTRKVVEAARPAGVSVEAELGRLSGTEDEVKVDAREAFFTDPGEAVEFVRQTGIDSLAVAIGNAHGRYRGLPQLDFHRLTTLHRLLDIPLVLHGASGLSKETLQRAIRLGISKINIDTDLREGFSSAIRDVFAQNPGETDPRLILGPARERVTATVREKIGIFSCKADHSQSQGEKVI